MFEILAQEAVETVAKGPGAVEVYGPWGILIALGGWKGIAQFILWIQGRTGNGKGKDYVSRSECEIMHKSLERTEDDRHGTVMAAIQEVKDAINRVHERIDEVVRSQ